MPVLYRYLLRFGHWVLAVVAACLAPGCHLLTPEDPPLEARELNPDDFAWDYMDIARAYEFIGVPRIDCPMLEDSLKKTGHCNPVKHPFGTLVECPLRFPAKTLEFGCIPGESVPAVFARLTWDARTHVDFDARLRKCTMKGAGPANGEPERYPADSGYKVCLFESANVPGRLFGRQGDDFPAGTFFDFSDNPRSIEELEKMTVLMTADAPVSLVMDTRLLDESERAAALDELVHFFNIYRKMPVVSNIRSE